MLKSLASGLILMALGLAIFLYGAPPIAKEHFITKLRRLSGHDGQQCFDIWKYRLDDPYSTVIYRAGAHEGVLTVFFYAKNQRGAYELEHFECVADENGGLDEKASKDLEHEWLMNELR